MKNLTILGSTGSIGTQALDVVGRYPDSLRIHALTASISIEKLASQIRTHHPELVVVRGPDESERLSLLIDDLDVKPRIMHSLEGLVAAAQLDGVDSVLNGLVGSAGLIPTLRALEAGKEVLLANKESLVMAGSLIRGFIDKGCGSLVPVDSEHSAIFQCLGTKASHPGLNRIILTASGGPFRDLSIEQFENLTPEQALNHPTWKMGPKITIDSATLFNKGLEIIEAHWLFDLPSEKIDVVIHPSSIVHSLVEFSDGSLLAQLSHPTMEIPIQFALLGGERRPTTVQRLDLGALGKLEFFPPDPEKFPSLRLARQALLASGTAPAVLSASNEEAVGLFLDGKISFRGIAKLVEETLKKHDVMEPGEEEVLIADAWARKMVRHLNN